jgi:hypothetical protein
VVIVIFVMASPLTDSALKKLISSAGSSTFSLPVQFLQSQQIHNVILNPSLELITDLNLVEIHRWRVGGMPSGPLQIAMGSQGGEPLEPPAVIKHLMTINGDIHEMSKSLAG